MLVASRKGRLLGCPTGCYRPLVGLVLAPMADVQRVVAVEIAVALGVDDWSALGAQLLAAERNRVWLSPPLLSIAAGVLTVVTSAADESPAVGVHRRTVGSVPA